MNLSDRIAAAQGPDRALDAEIARIQNPQATPKTIAPHYTSSVDAALTLVPEGWFFGLGNNGNAKGDWKPWAWVAQPHIDAWRVSAATPALALCAAALKARGL